MRTAAAAASSGAVTTSRAGDATTTSTPGAPSARTAVDRLAPPIRHGCASLPRSTADVPLFGEWAGPDRRVARAGTAVPVLRRYPTTWLIAGWRRLGGCGDDFDDVRRYVIFVGHPRTGHSLVGALLDAHPDALVAHEARRPQVRRGRVRPRPAVRPARPHRAGRGRRRAPLVDAATSTRCRGSGRAGTERLEVIGDKKGGRSTMRLGDDLGLLDRLPATRRRRRHAGPGRAQPVRRHRHDAPPGAATARWPTPSDLFFGLADTSRRSGSASGAIGSTSSTSSDLDRRPAPHARRPVPASSVSRRPSTTSTRARHRVRRAPPHPRRRAVDAGAARTGRPPGLRTTGPRRLPLRRAGRRATEGAP